MYESQHAFDIHGNDNDMGDARAHHAHEQPFADHGRHLAHAVGNRVNHSHVTTAIRHFQDGLAIPTDVSDAAALLMANTRRYANQGERLQMRAEAARKRRRTITEEDRARERERSKTRRQRSKLDETARAKECERARRRRLSDDYKRKQAERARIRRMNNGGQTSREHEKDQRFLVSESSQQEHHNGVASTSNVAVTPKTDP